MYSQCCNKLPARPIRDRIYEIYDMQDLWDATCRSGTTEFAPMILGGT